MGSSFLTELSFAAVYSCPTNCIILLSTGSAWGWGQGRGSREVGSILLRCLGGDYVLGLGWGLEKAPTLCPRRLWGQGGPGKERGPPLAIQKTGVGVCMFADPATHPTMQICMPECAQVGLTGDARLNTGQYR